MNIRRRRIKRDTGATDPTLQAPIANQPKAQDDDQRQHNAVVANVHILPTVPLAPDLPAIDIAPEPGVCSVMIERNRPRQDHNCVREAQQRTQACGPRGDVETVQREKRQRLSAEIGRQQQP